MRWTLNLEVIIEGEVAAVLVLRLGRRGGVAGDVLLGAVHDTGLLVLADALLEEVGLAAERDVLHEVEGVGGAVVLVIAEGEQQAVGDELDVLLHQVGVHAEQAAGEGLRQELLLDLYRVDDDVLDQLLAGAVLQVREQQAREVRVQALVARDELVGEGQARHQAALLEPEDGGEGSAEEDTLDGGEGNQTLGEGRLLVVDPA